MTNTLEIERKFLVRSQDWGTPRKSIQIRQGYILSAPDRSLRIRQKGSKFLLTLKAAHGPISRYEFEYEVPEDDGARMLDELCTRAPIEKVRHEVVVGHHVWEIDVFSGVNAGLVLAEVELTAADEAFVKPDWLGPEVSHDPRFANANLYETPFSDWGESYDTLLKAG